VSESVSGYMQLARGLEGLTPEKVNAQTRAGLVNNYEEKSSRSVVWIILKNLGTVFNLMIFPLLAMLLALGQYKDVISVGGIALLNTVINIFQEIRAKLALERIRVENPITARVIRGGEIREVAVRAIVLEDYLLLAAGDRVVGDAEIIRAEHLEMDESMLTGESDYVPKKAGDEVLAGSFVIAGMAVARVTRLGENAYIQRIVSLSRKYVSHRTLLERRMDILVYTSMFLCFVVAGFLLLFYQPIGNKLIDPLRYIVASVTSLIPQGLVLVVTLAFALGVIAFAKRGVVFSRFNAVESLANIDLLCMDKTGTLTENRISLEKIELLDPDTGEAQARTLLSVFAAGLSAKNKTVEALLADPARIDGWRFLDEIPFKSKNKWSVVRAAPPQGWTHSDLRALPENSSAIYDIVLGAAEFLAPRFANPENMASLRERIRVYETGGLRTVVLALRRVSPDPALGEDTLAGIIPVALVIFSELLRAEAGEILAQFTRRGVRQVLISGDSPDTVSALARRLALPGAENVVSGTELSALEGDSLRGRILSANIFARVLPEQKQAIIRAFRGAGHHVAMIGDGVNDVLALKEAELSIAMGSGGSMVKDVSDMVLVRDKFDILPHLLEEGERIIARIRDCARIFTLKNSYALLLILATIIFGATFPFFPQQITMINFVTITLPLLYIIQFTRGQARVEKGFVWDIVRFSFCIACVVAGASFGLNVLASADYPNLIVRDLLGVGWFFGRYSPNPSLYVQTLSIVPIILMASLVFLALARSSSSSRNDGKIGTRGILLPALLSLGLCLIFFGSLYIPGIADFMEFVPLGMEDYQTIAYFLVPALVLETLLLWVFLRRRKSAYN